MTRKEREKLWSPLRETGRANWNEEQVKINEEINCMDMIDSIICYNSRDLDYILNDHYMESFINRLGIERVKELIQGQIDEKPYIIKNVYTDCEGLTYNTLIFKDEEGYIYE
jgi:hypothetical protein